MTKGQAGWILLAFLAITLIIIGIQGSLGVAIAIIFCPSEVTLTEGGNVITATAPSTGTGSTTSGG